MVGSLLVLVPDLCKPFPRGSIPENKAQSSNLFRGTVLRNTKQLHIMHKIDAMIKVDAQILAYIKLTWR